MTKAEWISGITIAAVALVNLAILVGRFLKSRDTTYPELVRYRFEEFNDEELTALSRAVLNGIQSSRDNEEVAVLRFMDVQITSEKQWRQLSGRWHVDKALSA